MIVVLLTSIEAMAPTPYRMSNLTTAIAAYDTAGTLADFDWYAVLQAGGQIYLEISSGVTNGPKDLAYLSACSTTAPGPVDPDLTVAAFLQIAGFNNVVATLGPVHDGAAVEMAKLYYDSWLRDQRKPSKALLTAMEACAAKYPNQPWRWAYWVHAGGASQGGEVPETAGVGKDHDRFEPGSGHDDSN